MSKFGIGADTKSSISAPFEVTPEKPFNQAFLVSVKSELKKIEKGDDAGKEKATLSFEFLSPDKTKRHVQTYFELNQESEKFQKALEILNQKIKHLYEAFAPFPTNGIGNDLPEDATFADFYDAIALAFNNPSNEETPKPIYKGKKCWVLLTYNNKGRLEIGFPNFIELVTTQSNEKPLTLFVKDSDRVAKPVTNAANPANTPIADDAPAGWN